MTRLDLRSFYAGCELVRMGTKVFFERGGSLYAGIVYTKPFFQDERGLVIPSIAVFVKEPHSICMVVNAADLYLLTDDSLNAFIAEKEAVLSDARRLGASLSKLANMGEAELRVLASIGEADA